MDHLYYHRKRVITLPYAIRNFFVIFYENLFL